MTDIKKFKRGNRTYTRVGQFKEVRIDGTPSKESSVPAPAVSVSMDIDSRTETGIYSNTTMVHRSADEIVVDFSYLPPHSTRGRVLSRVILSPKQARMIANLLKQASEETK